MYRLPSKAKIIVAIPPDIISALDIPINFSYRETPPLRRSKFKTNLISNPVIITNRHILTTISTLWK